tara:strand:+ start:1412 stop:2785 length:1374 start_codon:yes stop_codon:yes gene_type:complete
MPLTKATFSMISGACVNVLDYGADPTAATDSTAAIAAAIAAGRRIYFPEGTYKCNIDLIGVEGKYLEGETQGQGGVGASATGVRLIPQDNTKPLIDVVGPSIDVIIENFFLDSQISGLYTHTGIGIRFQAFSPDYVWRSAIRHVYIRGFQDGLVMDCDINTSEIFNCDFQDIEVTGCSRYSFKTRGVYNRFGKLFATQCGIFGGAQPTADYAFYHDGSGCFFDSAVSDGRHYWAGTRNFVGIALIEAIFGPGHGGAGFPAMELSGTQFNIWQQVSLSGVPDSKYKVGFRIAGTNQTIGTAVVEGANYPSTGFLFAPSSGVLTMAYAPGTKAPQPENWNFLGDVSGAIEGGGPQPFPWVFKSAWNGTSFIVDMGTWNLVLDPNAAPLASGTLTMPQANPPLDGQTLTISTTKTITSMEFKTTGIYFFYDGSQSITQTFSAGASRSFIFRLSNYTWYPL